MDTAEKIGAWTKEMADSQTNEKDF